MRTTLISELKERLPRPVRYRLKWAYLAVLSYAFRGHGVYCPCCGKEASRFTRGLLPRQVMTIDMCPHCGSAPRHRVLGLYLQRETDVFDRPGSVLHFAPEPTFLRAFSRQRNLDYIPVDLDPGPNITAMDITSISLPDDSVDWILCSHVLEHIPDDSRAMRELQRVLRPDGTAILMVPIDLDRAQTLEDQTATTPLKRVQVYGQHDHVRIYGRDFASRLSAAGFAVNECAYPQTLPEADRKRFGLRVGQDVLYICQKGGRS